MPVLLSHLVVGSLVVGSLVLGSSSANVAGSACSFPPFLSTLVTFSLVSGWKTKYLREIPGP